MVDGQTCAMALQFSSYSVFEHPSWEVKENILKILGNKYDTTSLFGQCLRKKLLFQVNRYKNTFRLVKPIFCKAFLPTREPHKPAVGKSNHSWEGFFLAGLGIQFLCWPSLSKCFHQNFFVCHSKSWSSFFFLHLLFLLIEFFHFLERSKKVRSNFISLFHEKGLSLIFK